MSIPQNNPPAKVETYLFFDGRCEDAIEFYRRALGAEVMRYLVRYDFTLAFPARKGQSSWPQFQQRNSQNAVGPLGFVAAYFH